MIPEYLCWLNPGWAWHPRRTPGAKLIERGREGRKGDVEEISAAASPGRTAAQSYMVTSVPLLCHGTPVALGSRGSSCPHHGLEEMGAFKWHCNQLGQGSAIQILHNGCMQTYTCTGRCDCGAHK